MLASLFYKLLYMSLIASLVGLSIMLIRRVFDKRIPPIWKYAMWSVVLFALIMPYRPRVNFLPKQAGAISNRVENFVTSYHKVDLSEIEGKPIQMTKGHDVNQNFVVAGEPQNERGATPNEGVSRNSGNPEQALSEDMPEFQKEATDYSVTDKYFRKAFILNTLLPAIWIAGVVILLLHFTVTKIRLSGSTSLKIKAVSPTGQSKKSVIWAEKIQRLLQKCKEDFGIEKEIAFSINSKVSSPAITGILHPTIMFPEYAVNMSEESLAHTIYHELAHYQRKDLWMNTLLLACQILYWFNPLVWVMFKLIRNDMEVLTDDYVLERIGENHKKAYATSLVEVLASANNLSFMPKMLCMVDGKKNIERRIHMIKLGERFKKHRVLIGVLCLAVIVGLGGVFLTACKSDKQHKIAIYKLYGSEFLEKDYQNYGDVIKDGKIVGDVKPVLTEKDIVGYNPETQMIFLSDEVMEKYKKDLAETENADLLYGHLLTGGSLILGGNESSVFVITVDDEVVLGGSFERSVYSNYTTSGFTVKDCSEGIRLYILRPENGVTDADYEQRTDKLAEAFEDMELTTDELFDLQYWGLGYDTNALWENRLERVDENSDIEALLSQLVFPEGTTYQTFEIESEPDSYRVTLFLDVDDTVNYENSDYGKYLEENLMIYEANSRILMALLGNVSKITYVVQDVTVTELPASNNGATKSFVVGAKERKIPIMTFVDDYYLTQHPEAFESGKGIYCGMSPKLFYRCQTAFDFYKEFSGNLDFDKAPTEMVKFMEEAGYVDADDITPESLDSSEEDYTVEEKQVIYNEVELALSEIMSSPTESSSPRDFLEEHEEAANEILSEGEISLEYMLREFEKGADGLKAQIMAKLCQEIVGTTANVGDYETGEEWYEKYINRKVIQLPNYTPSKYTCAIGGDEVKSIYDYHGQTQGEIKDTFHVLSMKTYNRVRVGDLMKHIYRVIDHEFKLCQEASGEYVLYDIGYVEKPEAMTYQLKANGAHQKDENGDYVVVDVDSVDLVDGYDEAMYNFCTAPTGWYDEELAETVVEDDLKDLYKKSIEDLKKHLFDNGIEKVTIVSSFDFMDFEYDESVKGQFLYLDDGIFVHTDGTESRKLTKEEIEDINEAFEMVIDSTEEGRGEFNPICNFFSSYYEYPEHVDISRLIRDMQSDKHVEDDEFEDLKKLEAFPYKNAKTLADTKTPVRRIPDEYVEELLEQFLGVSVSELSGVGAEKSCHLGAPYHAYYTYVGPNREHSVFHCVYGKLDGDTITLGGEDATLVLKRVNVEGEKNTEVSRFYIESHLEK